MELPENIQDQFDHIDDQIETFYNEGNHEKIIAAELEKWELLPSPKEHFDESFFIARSLAEEYLEIEDYTSSKTWGKILFDCDKERADDGDRELVSGKIYFESKDFKEALEYFKIAFQKSKGRSFEDEDPKYLDFYRNPEKYTKP